MGTTLDQKRQTAVILSSLTQSELAKFSGASEKSVYLYLKGKLPKRNAHSAIDQALDELGLEFIGGNYDAEKFEKKIQVRRLEEKLKQSRKQKDSSLDIGRVNIFDDLDSEITKHIFRSGTPDGWERKWESCNLNLIGAEKLLQAVRDRWISDFPSLKAQKQPIYVIEESLSIDEDQGNWLKKIPEYFEVADNPASATDLARLVDQHSAKHGLRDHLEEGEELGLRLLVGHAHTPVPIHHNPASNQVEEVGYLKFPVILIISTAFTSALIRHIWWEPPVEYTDRLKAGEGF